MTGSFQTWFRRRQLWILGAGLVLLALLLYAGTLGFDFLRLDDADYTFGCPFVKGGLSLGGMAEAFRNLRHGGIWMPFTYLSYMADISLFGPSPAGHHLVNVLLHALNGVLLFRLLLALLPDRTQSALALAFVAAAFWVVHPQRVEAVAWIASRKELLWTAFALFGILAWIQGRTWSAAAFAAFACLSKPTAMVFPFLALSVDLLRGQRIRWTRYLPLLALAVATGLIALYSQTHPEGMAVQEVYAAPFGTRLLRAASAVGHELRQLVMPSGLHLDYRYLPEETPIALGFLVALLLAVVIVARSACRRTVFAAMLWFAAAVGPTLGLFASFGEQARADRFVYLAMMAVSVLLVRGFRSERARTPVTRVLVVEILLCFGISCLLVRTYRNDRTAFERTLQCDPEHGRALAHLGEAKCAEGALDSGIEMLEESLLLRPVPDTLGKLTYALMRRGKAEDFRAIRALCVGLAEHPENDRKGQALEALGTACLKAHDWANAAEYLYLSVTASARFYSPEDAKLKLAFAWYNGGRAEDAKQVLDQLAGSSRADISERAKATLIAVYEHPDVLLIW